MAVIIGRNEVNVKKTTRPMTIPSNDTARMMYYLSCVCNVIDCDRDEDIRRLTNYANWARLSTDERRPLLVLCYTFSPDVFGDKVFFHREELCVQFSNEFYTINQMRHRLVAVESIIIAGRERQVNKIMTYKMSWMRMYYLEPMPRLARQLVAQPSRSQYTAPHRQPQPRRPQYTAPHRQPQPWRPAPAPVADSDCCCTIL
jgi:hypothetical protein